MEIKFAKSHNISFFIMFYLVFNQIILNKFGKKLNWLLVDYHFTCCLIQFFMKIAKIIQCSFQAVDILSPK
jgi:hypothetical protein